MYLAAYSADCSCQAVAAHRPVVAVGQAHSLEVEEDMPVAAVVRNLAADMQVAVDRRVVAVVHNLEARTPEVAAAAHNLVQAHQPRPLE